jgi:thioredoxin reductase (NADPH)
MTDTEHLYDLTVIGGGPVGMFTAFYAGMRQLDTQLIESLPELGGQVSALYPEKIIRDVAGFPAVKGKELIANLNNQLTEFDEFKPDIFCGEEVLTLAKDSDGFTITTSKRTTRTKSIIIAIGSGAFSPRPLAADYDKALEDNKIFYFVKDLNRFAGKNVVVAGGGDSAIDWALMLEPIANKVSIVHRRNQFRGLESSVNRLKASSVEILTPYNVDNVTDAGADGLTIGLKKAKAEDTLTLTADALLVNYGFITDNKVLKKWGLPLEHRMLTVDAHMETGVPNIYGVGDAVTYEGKVKLIAAGFGEVPSAVNHLAVSLYPERKQPLHSSSL